MTRFWGPIGISRGPRETASPGVITNDIEEVWVSGEIRNARLSWPNAGIQKSISTQHTLSIVTPEDSDITFSEVVYVVWQNTKWSVTAIQYIRPRVELTLGGVYNG